MAEPDLRAVTGEPDPIGRAIRPEGKSALSEVGKDTAANLGDPCVKLPVAVGDKCRQFSIWRDSRLRFVAFEIGQPLDLGAGERIFPKVIPLPKTPQGSPSDQNDDRREARHDWPDTARCRK